MKLTKQRTGGRKDGRTDGKSDWLTNSFTQPMKNEYFIDSESLWETVSRIIDSMFEGFI
jgi:hypothetical protein